MKKKRNWVGMLAMIFVLGMAVIGCDNDPTNGNGNGNGNGTGTGGTFTLNNIPSQYNGKFALLMSIHNEFSNPPPEYVDNGIAYFGGQNINLTTGILTAVPISNGSVNIPLWTINMNDNTAARYSGNDTIILGGNLFISSFFVGIYDIATITFEQMVSNYYAAWELSSGSIIFSNGNVSRSWGDGQLLED